MSEPERYRQSRRGREPRVNGPRAYRNRRTVLTFPRTQAQALGALAYRAFACRVFARCAFTLGVGLSALGCGGARGAEASLEGLAPGTTTLRIENHVGTPSTLDRVSITIDGDPVPLSSLPPEGAPAATIGALRLQPGAHTIAVRAKARAPNSEVIVVGAQQPFHVMRGPAAITVDVRSGAGHDGPTPSSPAGEPPLVVSLTILGGTIAPEIGVAPADGKDDRCSGLLPIPRALCRAAFDLDEATRRKDLVAAVCLRDKIAEMRRLANISESGGGDSPALAEARVAVLAREVDRCVGTDLAAPAVDGTTVRRVRSSP